MPSQFTRVAFMDGEEPPCGGFCLNFLFEDILLYTHVNVSVFFWNVKQAFLKPLKSFKNFKI